MSLLLLLLLPLSLSNRVSSEQSGLVNNAPGETMYKMSEKTNGTEDKFEELVQRVERMDISWKAEKAHLEKKLETKNVEVENLQKRVKQMEVQFESRLEEAMLSTQKKNHQEVTSLKSQMADLQNQLKEVKAQNKNQNQDVANSEMKMHCQAEVKKELDKVLPTAVEQGLRDLPFEMVCVYKFIWDRENAVISYDQITLEFNNSDRPGGADGSMNIETGVFTTVTSGYYIITVSAIAAVHAGFYSDLFLYHNGVPVQESQFVTSLSGGEFIYEQGSRTVILHLLAGDTLDLRTNHIGADNSYELDRITWCLYMAPAPYGL